jgi:hypothetical protein
VIVLHGDDQGHLEDLLPVLESGRYQTYDCCLGARFMKGSVLEGYSRFRTFGNRVYDLLFSAVTCRRVSDLGSGLNVYDVKMLKSNFYHNLRQPHVQLLHGAGAAGLQKHRVFFPIRWSEDDQVLQRQAHAAGVQRAETAVFLRVFPEALSAKRASRHTARARYEADEIASVPAAPNGRRP